MNRRNRTINFILLALATGSHLFTQNPPLWHWALLGLVFVIYPQLAYWLAKQYPAQQQRRAEMRNMLCDGVFFGMWSVLLGFPLWPSFMFFMGVTTNLMIFASYQGCLKAFACFIFGAALAQWMQPAPLNTATSLVTTALCMLTLMLFMLSVARDAYVRSTALHRHRTQLQKQLEANRTLQAQLSDLATKDPLTGLYNRRQLDASLREVLGNAHGASGHAALVLIDVDYFKEINDQYGHAAGDEVLHVVAQELQRSSRSCDVAIRYGGDEFLLIFKDITADTALHRAQQICEKVASIEFKTRDHTFFISLSCGIALTPQHTKDQASLLQCADTALYHSKSQGRNKATLYETHLETGELVAK